VPRDDRLEAQTMVRKVLVEAEENCRV